MKDYSSLIKAVEDKGNEVFWFGGASDTEISRLETLLGAKLPPSYRDFLSHYGGGGVIESEFSGIEDNDAELDDGGTTFGDTLYCREEFDLPKHLIVIYLRDDEICWCLDATHNIDDKGEYPVVSYDVFSRKVVKKMADSFEDFFIEYLELRGQD